MQPKSAFQQQFPLSSKKIIKKMVPIFISGGLVTLFFSMFVGSGLNLVFGYWDTNNWSGVIGVFILCLVIFYTLYVAAYYFYWRAYIDRYYYSADEHFLTIKKGVFAPAEIHVQYLKIQDVYVDQDLFDRILGLYDVHIASATVTSGIEAHIDGVDQAVAEGLKNWLLGHVSGSSATMAETMPTTPPVPGAPMTTNVTVNVPPNVDYQHYPIQNGWYVQSVFQALVLSLILGFWLGAGLLREEIGVGVYIQAGLIVVLFLFQIMMAVLWKQTFSWSFTPEFILTKEGVISRKETHVPYRTIQDVILNQSIFERLLGLCTVRVENATAVSGGRRGSSINRGPRFPGQSLAKGQELVEILKTIRSSGAQQTGL